MSKLDEFLARAELFKVETGKDEIYDLNRNSDSAEQRLWLLEYFEDLYQTTKKYVPEKDYSKRFSDDVIGRWWEMHLIDELLKSGNCLCDPIGHGPDICVQTKQGRIWIEAISLTHGTGDDKVPNIVYDSNIALRVPAEEAVLRFTGAMRDKHLQTLKYLDAGIIRSNDKVIVAVNVSGIDMAYIHDEEGNMAKKSLFGQGDFTLLYNVSQTNPSVVDSYYANRPMLIKKNETKAKVKTNCFLTGEYKEISGVITNSVGFMKPQDICSYNWCYFENPTTEKPLNTSELIAKGTYHHWRKDHFEPYRL